MWFILCKCFEKRIQGHPTSKHQHLKSMFHKLQIKPNNRSAIREFYHQVKLNFKWLLSLGYKTPFYSYDND